MKPRAIPPRPDLDPRQWRAARARAEQQAVNAFLRRVIIKGLLREMEKRGPGRVKPHSKKARDALSQRLKGIRLKYDADHWVRKALTVTMETIIDDVKAIRSEKSRD
jgi:hypothetical protein